MMRSGRRAGGIITLDQIRGPVPLASNLEGPCPAGIDQSNAYQMLDSFWINPFASHVDYELYQ